MERRKYGKNGRRTLVFQPKMFGIWRVKIPVATHPKYPTLIGQSILRNFVNKLDKQQQFTVVAIPVFNAAAIQSTQ